MPRCPSTVRHPCVDRWLQLLDHAAMKKPTGDMVSEEQAVSREVEPNARGGHPWLVQSAA
jgi:hypothetical protein